ncbi:MAG: hypothetical protein DRI61_09715 [Chloroflexi bacterium]|nr:MAG: hypothetical protein DRI61_09715 [Chloroflexota bacterium]
MDTRELIIKEMRKWIERHPEKADRKTIVIPTLSEEALSPRDILYHLEASDPIGEFWLKLKVHSLIQRAFEEEEW